MFGKPVWKVSKNMSGKNFWKTCKEYTVDNVAEKVGEKVAGDAFRNVSKKLFKNMSRKRFENVSKKVIQKNLVENMAEIVAENKSLKCMGCKTDMNHRAIIYYLSKLA